MREFFACTEMLQPSIGRGLKFHELKRPLGIYCCNMPSYEEPVDVIHFPFFLLSAFSKTFYYNNILFFVAQKNIRTHIHVFQFNEVEHE